MEGDTFREIAESGECLHTGCMLSYKGQTNNNNTANIYVSLLCTIIF